MLQVIFRALWDECLLLISCLQLNDNRFCPIMKQLDAIVIQNIAACFCEASIRIYQKGCSWSFKFSLENYLEIWCSIIKPKKEPGNYRLELAIESWCWWWPSPPQSPPPIITNYKSTINTRHCRNTDLVCAARSSLLPAYWLHSTPPAPAPAPAPNTNWSLQFQNNWKL